MRLAIAALALGGCLVVHDDGSGVGEPSGFGKRHTCTLVATCRGVVTTTTDSVCSADEGNTELAYATLEECRTEQAATCGGHFFCEAECVSDSSDGVPSLCLVD